MNVKFLQVLITAILSISLFTFPPPTLGEPTPTVSSPEPVPEEIQCEYNEFRTSWYFNNSLYCNFNVFPPTCDFSNLIRDGNPDSASCIRDEMQSALSICASYVGTMVHRIDDCIAYRIFGAMQTGVNCTDATGAYIDQSYYYDVNLTWGPPWSQNTIFDTQLNTTFCHPPDNNGFTYCCRYSRLDTSARIYIKKKRDGTCSTIPNLPASQQACYAGIYDWYTSPISLLWNNKADIEKEYSIVQFPLDPRRKSDTWYIWKASADAPLLVYDPKQSGMITSATQLFGDWTFGGQKSASLLSGHLRQDNFASLPTPWKNGYEALSTLDTNGDQKVSGEELKPLALWFDENRNGIAESGETKTLSEVGVISLFYSPNREDAGTKSIYADVGYERSINGKIITGASVDWKSDAGDSRSELINKHLAPTIACLDSTGKQNEFKPNNLGSIENPKTSLNTVNTRTNEDGITSNNLSRLSDSTLSGLWKWSSDDTDGKGFIPNGYLGFSDIGTGAIHGHAYSWLPLTNKKLDIDNIFSATKLLGFRQSQTDGKILLNFIIKPSSGNELQSKAIFDPKKDKLYGTTVAKVSFGGKPVELKYSWTATRVQSRPQR